MKKKIFTLCITLIFSCGAACAQEWSREDSIWLINVLEGKYDLKINEDTKKAIEDGRLALPSWMKNDEGKVNNIDITSDFDNAGVPDSARIHSVNPYSMPPAVFAMYILYTDKMDSIYESRSIIITDREKEMLIALLPTGTVQAFSLSFYMHYGNNSNVITFANRGMGQMLFQSAIGPSVSATTDFNHLLSMVFSPSHRQKVHNRKHATAYKGYYDEGAISPVGVTERERRQLRQAMRNAKPTVAVGRTSEIRRSGIDD